MSLASPPPLPLREARALVVGAGGLGVPAALALAEAGIGTLGILDPDRVERSNLHRQILYGEADVGSPKIEALAVALGGRFAGLTIAAEAIALSAATADRLAGWDVVLDGTDRFETKLALSDACTDRGLAYVFAGVVGFEAQVLAVRPGVSACPRCLFDEAPPPWAAPGCSDLGILGPVAGIAGARQAEAAIGLLMGRTDVLDRLWTYDGRRDVERIVRLRRAPDCKGCGARRSMRGQMAPLETEADLADAPVLDLEGAACPATYLATRRALEALPSGGRLWVHLSSDESARNVPASAVAAGHRLLASRSDGWRHRILLERGADPTFLDSRDPNDPKEVPPR